MSTSNRLKFKRLCALQRRRIPVVNAGTLVFIGDHGVAASQSDGGEGCSAYPQVWNCSLYPY